MKLIVSSQWDTSESPIWEFLNFIATESKFWHSRRQQIQECRRIFWRTGIILNASIYQGSFNRKIYIFVSREESSGGICCGLFKKSHKEKPGIVYCSTRKSVDSMYSYLKEICGYSVGKYHGGMENRREKKVKIPLQDKLQVMVATNAFGMGIDKSNVRFVIHANCRVIWELLSEAGRAGRDGGQAEAILLYQEEDIATQRFFIEKTKRWKKTLKKKTT